MLLFRLVDLPRTVRRLIPPMPAALGASERDVDDALRDLRVDWTLRPTPIQPGSARMRARIDEALALYAGAVGQPRSAVEALSPGLRRSSAITGWRAAYPV